MAYNGSGAFTIDTAGNPVSSGTTIDPAVHNTTNTEIATGLTTAICKDGQTTITQNIPFNNKKITGLAAGTAKTDAATLGNVVDGTGVYVVTVGGTADVITLTPSPAITAYAAGQIFRFIASGANTTNVTVDVSGFGPKAITKNGTTALVAGDISASMMVQITYDGTRFILGTIGASSITPPDNVFRIIGSADGSKKAAFEVDGITTGTTRTYTLQDSSDVIVGRNTTDTLTNKTFTGGLVTGDPSAALGIASKQYVDALSVPTGLISPYGGSSAPTGWLLCDGSAISRATYSGLFAILSVNYGVGDGATTFNLPDMRGRVPMGVDGAANRITAASTNGGNADTLGGVGGAETHTLTNAEAPAHTHDIKLNVGSGSGHTVLDEVSQAANQGLSSTFVTGSTGSGGAHSNTQPWQTVNYIVKT